MGRSPMRKLAAGAAVVVVLVGVAIAASASGHRGNPVRRAAHARRAAKPGAGVNLAKTASYLGVSRPRLRSELKAGRTLGQIADATPGRSQAGLIEALVKAKRQQLAKAVSARKLTPTEARARLARFTKSVGVLVDHRTGARTHAVRSSG